MAAGGHFGCPKITLDHISGHFTSIRNFNFFGKIWQNGWHRPFWMSEFHFQSHFWPFQINTQLKFFFKFLTKWLTSAILDIWNSLSIAFLAISDRYRIFFSAAILDVWKSLWIAFLAISDWSAILDVRNSLSMTFLAISDPYGTLFIFLNFWQNGRWLDYFRVKDQLSYYAHGCGATKILSQNHMNFPFQWEYLNRLFMISKLFICKDASKRWHHQEFTV